MTGQARSSAWLGTLLLSAPTAISQAGVSERDWRGGQDGLLTYDHTNQREWLDFSETLPHQYSGGLQGQFDAVTGRDTTRRPLLRFQDGNRRRCRRPLQIGRGIASTTSSTSNSGCPAEELIGLLGWTHFEFSPLFKIQHWSLVLDFPEVGRIIASIDSRKAGFTDTPLYGDPTALPYITRSVALPRRRAGTRVKYTPNRGGGRSALCTSPEPCDVVVRLYISIGRGGSFVVADGGRSVHVWRLGAGPCLQPGRHDAIFRC